MTLVYCASEVLTSVGKKVSAFLIFIFKGKKLLFMPTVI